MGQRILGLDIGEKRIGIAVSDGLNITAQGIGVIERKNLKEDFKKINEVVTEYAVIKIIMGLPLNMNGSEGKSAKLAMDFASNLKEKIPIDIEMIDERLTTKQGERILLEADISRKKRKKNIDKIAAQLILQNYLDLQKRELTRI